MCLLVAITHAHPDAPLFFAANRDEWLARPATAMEVLRTEEPRTLGGRDLLAHGTWLAVNAHGIVAALTNRAARGERDPSRKSRGELPLMLTEHTTARAAAEALASTVRAEDYNPCWLLVGDRRSLHYIDLTGYGHPPVRDLGPGVHVLENQAIDAPSAKAALVRERVIAALPRRDREFERALWSTLADHTVPTREDPGGAPVPAMRAACVHAGPYGTRWSSVIRVPAHDGDRAEIQFVDGRPCEQTPQRADALWSEPG